MKKFTKSLLTLVLLVLAVGGAKAGVRTIVKTVNYTTNPVKVDGADHYQSGYPWYWMGDADNQPNCCGGTATAQLNNGAFEIKNTKEQTNNYDLQLFVADKIAIKAGYSYTIKITMKANGNGSANLSFSDGWSASANKEFNFTASDAYTEYVVTIDKKDVTSKIAGNNGHVVFQCGKFVGTVSIQSVVVIEEAPEVVVITEVEKYAAPTGTKDINGMTGAGDIKWDVTYPKEMGPGVGWCGDIDSNNKGVDISTYKYLHFVVTEVSEGANLGVRVFVWDGSTRICLYPHLITTVKDVTNWTTFSPITSTGTYVVDISSYPLLRGFKGGNSWEDGNKGTAVISMAYVSSGSDPVAYTPTGETTSSGTEYLSGKNITCFDATGLISSGQTLDAANPNALFIAKAGILNNSNNVIVSGTCANLVLTDGNYPFKAPADFTATSVSYDRTFTVDQPSTVCLPFDLTADQVTEAGTFYELTGYSDNTLTFSEVATTEAYKPYLFKAAKANPFTSYSGKAVGETPTEIEDLSVSVAEGAATMTGTMARQSVNGKYGWNSVGGAFSKATSDEVTIDPFRAYITISGGGLARVAARFVDNSVTGINEVSETQNILNPDRKYIENNNIVIVKNGVKFNAAGQLLK